MRFCRSSCGHSWWRPWRLHLHVPKGFKKVMFGLVIAILVTDFIHRGPSVADLAFFWAVILDVVEDA